MYLISNIKLKQVQENKKEKRGFLNPAKF